MNFRMKPLVLAIVFALSYPHQVNHSLAQEAPVETTPETLPPLGSSTPYPSDLMNQLPDFQNASGNNVTFTGPGSVPAPYYGPDANGIDPGQSGYTPTVVQPTAPAPVLNIGLGNQQTVIDWGGRGFDVGKDATVNFKSGVSDSAVLNYDSSGTMSVIDGKVTSDGAKLFLVNPNGISDQSGAFSGLFANEKENVQLTRAGTLRLATQGNRVYGPVTGTVRTDQNFNVSLVDSTGSNTAVTVLGGNQVNLLLDDYNKETRAGGLNLQSNKAILAAPADSTGKLTLTDATIKNIEISSLQNVEVKGATDIDRMKVVNDQDYALVRFNEATGTVDNLDVENGFVRADVNGGSLTFNNMDYRAHAGNFEGTVGGGGTLAINNSKITLNSGGDPIILEEMDDTESSEDQLEANNTIGIRTEAGGGTLIISNSDLLVEGGAHFEDDTRSGNLLMSNTNLTTRSANVQINVNGGTRFETFDGEETSLHSDLERSSTQNKGMIIVQEGYTGSFGDERNNVVSYNDRQNFSSFNNNDHEVLFDWNQMTFRGGGISENKDSFDSEAPVIAEPGDTMVPGTPDPDSGTGPVIVNPGDGGTVITPTEPEEPGDGDNGENPTEPTTPVDPQEPGDGGTTEPTTPVDPVEPTEPGGNDGETPTDPETPIDPQEPGDGGTTDPTTPVDPTDPNEPTTPVDPEEPGNGGTNPENPDDGGVIIIEPTDPEQPGDGGSGEDPTEPTTPVDPTNPSDPDGNGGQDPTDPETPIDPQEPGDGGTTNPTTPVDPTDPNEPTAPVDPEEPGNGGTNPENPDDGGVIIIEPTDPEQPGSGEEPTDPTTPVEPTEPGGNDGESPADPETPIDPQVPGDGGATNPTNPVDPVDPTGPGGSDGETPSDPEAPIDPQEPGNDGTSPENPDDGGVIIIEPTTPEQPGDGDSGENPTDPTTPVDPSHPGSGGTTEPGGNDGGQDPVDPTVPVNPSEPGENDGTGPENPGSGGVIIEPTDPTTPDDGDTTEPTMPVDPTQPGGNNGSDGADPESPGDTGSTDPSNPDDGGVIIIEPTQPQNPGGNESPVAPTDPAEPVNPDEDGAENPDDAVIIEPTDPSVPGGDKGGQSGTNPGTPEYEGSKPDQDNDSPGNVPPGKEEDGTDSEPGLIIIGEGEDSTWNVRGDESAEECKNKQDDGSCES